MQRTAAFSLIELAIVIAIIGILAGSVMATSSYIKTAKLTTTINEGKYYLNALKQFQAKYDGGLPGDLGNASDYWTGATNGNGNGQIELNNEVFLAFNHLRRAEFISGNFSGTNGPAGANDAVIGLNVPSLSMEGATAWYWTPQADGYMSSASTDYYPGYYGTMVFIAKQSSNYFPTGGLLAPRQTLELDAKFDDGTPDKGWMRSMKSAGSCVDNTGTPIYRASDTVDACVLLMTQV